MYKAANFKLSRRSALKTGVASLALALMPIWSAKSIAQTANLSSPGGTGSKPNGLISFNAGWMIPAEDQKALLALEEKKKKEVESATKPATADPVNNAEATKPVKKSWGDKLQDNWKKVTNFF